MPDRLTEIATTAPTLRLPELKGFLKRPLDPRNYLDPRLCFEPQVEVVGATKLVKPPEDLERFFSGAPRIDQDRGPDGERIVEAAGRICYDSYGGRGRDSDDFHRHIQEVGHGSVLTHVGLVLAISGISRGLSQEHNRHHVGVGISQRSTRYVDESVSAFVLPPAFIIGETDDELRADWKRQVQSRLVTHHRSACALYDDLVGLPVHDAVQGTARRKAARSAARSVLGIGLETRKIWSANLRALLNYIEQRATDAADAEICRLALHILLAVSKHYPRYCSGVEFMGRSDGAGLCLAPTSRFRAI